MDNYIFSDASFHPQSKMAVCGFLKDGLITYEIIKETTNIKAEIYAFEMGKKISNISSIFATDCIKVYKLGDQQNLTMVKIKGHQPTKNKSEIDQEFTVLDKFLRRTLRKFIKILPSTQS